MKEWKTKRDAEKKRRMNAIHYSRYKNEFFVQLIRDATKTYNWTKRDIKRAKDLRKELEVEYNIPINFFRAFVYSSTYYYLLWKYRDLDYKNYIGFVISENNLVRFANYFAKRTISWRKKRSYYPENFIEKWGSKLPVESQRVGSNDEHVNCDMMSQRMKKKINRYI